MSSVMVNGIKFRVVEDLGFQNGHYAKVITAGDTEVVVAKKPGGTWQIWRPELLPWFPTVGQDA